MNGVAVIPAMSPQAIERVRAVEAGMLQHEQIPLPVDQDIHAGVYMRTIIIPIGVMITGVLVKIDTRLIVNGDVVVWLGDREARLTGYRRLQARAGRKQAFLALADTWLTMLFATAATTTDEAERQFTDEVEMLASRRVPCPA